MASWIRQLPSVSVHARTIRESHRATAVLSKAAGEYHRVEDLWDGWKWRLARDPRRDATPIPDVEPTTYLIRTALFPDAPELTILFTYDEDYVDIIAIRVH